MQLNIIIKRHEETVNLFIVEISIGQLNIKTLIREMHQNIDRYIDVILLFKEKVFYIFVDNIDFFTEPPRCQNRNELRTCHNSAHFIHRQTAKVMPIRYNSQCGFDWSITPLRP